MRFSCFRHLSACLLFILLWSACVPFAPAGTLTVTLPPPSETPTLIPPSTESAISTMTRQAPFCVWDMTPTPDADQCALPKGEARSRFCSKKVPYTLVALSAGNTYQVISPGIVCTDAGIKNGSQLLTCTGPPVTFAMRVCNPACALDLSTATPAAAGLCPPGFNYLADRSCCQAASTDQAGCVTLRFDIGTCGGVACGKIKNSAACSAAPGCIWVPKNGSTPAHCTSK